MVNTNILFLLSFLKYHQRKLDEILKYNFVNIISRKIANTLKTEPVLKPMGPQITMSSLSWENDRVSYLYSP
jgi:hypothetical protein